MASHKSLLALQSRHARIQFARPSLARSLHQTSPALTPRPALVGAAVEQLVRPLRGELWATRACRFSVCASGTSSASSASAPPESGESSTAPTSASRRHDDFGGPHTTYEGSSDSTDVRIGERCAGFSRATFVACEVQRHTEFLAKYSIGAELGVGATATVYRAVNVRTKQHVALKTISKDLVPHHQMLRNEIEIHKATDHPNILRLLETFEDDKFLYLVTEICDGGDLRAYMSAVGDCFNILQIAEEDALQLLRQIVASVRYLHKMGIVHRDLKPGNFLCAASAAGTSAVVLKLTDFGVSTSCGLKHLLTKRVGTDGFMAPEVLKCQPYNEKADIFSIGCLLHTLLTGNPPKRRDDGTYTLNKLRLNHVSADMRTLIEWLTQVSPEDRPSIEEVAGSPLLLTSHRRLRETSEKLGVQLLDRVYEYSAFPLLKKAALVAMVSRAESDVDFLPCAEKFMSFGSHGAMNFAIDATDLYEALLEELSEEMESMVKRTLRPDHGRRFARRRQPYCLRHDDLGGGRFKAALRSDVVQLVRKVDCDGSGSMSYSEWLAATVSPVWYSEPERIAAVFNLFDNDGDGMISEDDLKKVIPATFTGVSVDAVLQESQLSATETSWLDKDHFSLLMRTGSHSAFTLRRIAEGIEDPLSANSAAAGVATP
mmetsp:Transcript_14059/g.38432  ORF Transcript_14059/g.38432 Transcript_14059/m.38432 type:complete len:658 (-) Transcript_14059:58-2031(-)